MEDADRQVLEFIGDQGKTAEQVADRFPAFDVEGLVRGELVRPRRTTQSRRAPAAPDPTFYVLTSRGAEAIGLDPHTLHSEHRALWLAEDAARELPNRKPERQEGPLP